MKNRLLTFAGALALVAVLGKFYAQPLMAQVRAALVQDRDNIGRNFYQALGNCSNVTDPCVISYPAVPAGNRLIVQHVSVVMQMPPGVAPDLAELRGANVFQFLIPVAVPNNFTGENEYAANQPVLASYDAGQVPSVDVFAPTGSSTFTAVASISGYMIQSP